MRRNRDLVRSLRGLFGFLLIDPLAQIIDRVPDGTTDPHVWDLAVGRQRPKFSRADRQRFGSLTGCEQHKVGVHRISPYKSKCESLIGEIG